MPSGPRIDPRTTSAQYEAAVGRDENTGPQEDPAPRPRHGARSRPTTQPKQVAAERLPRTRNAKPPGPMAGALVRGGASGSVTRIPHDGHADATPVQDTGPARAG